MVELQQNYFLLFNVAEDFDVNLRELKRAYQQLQIQLHPDNFANNSARDQLQAVQVASHINNAYSTLKSPLKRAVYMLKLQGVDVDFDTTTTTDTHFLFQQMELRETLSDIAERLQGDGESVEVLNKKMDALEAQVKELYQACVTDFLACYEASRWSDAQQVLAKLHFVDKFSLELQDAQAQLLV